MEISRAVVHSLRSEFIIEIIAIRSEKRKVGEKEQREKKESVSRVDSNPRPPQKRKKGTSSASALRKNGLGS